MSLIIPKERKESIIFTRNFRIEGEIHVLASSRLSDELNIRAKEFLPVTNAKLYSLDNKLVYEVGLVLLNKYSIDMIIAD